MAKEDAIQGLNKEVELLQNALQQEARSFTKSSTGVDAPGHTWQRFGGCAAPLMQHR